MTSLETLNAFVEWKEAYQRKRINPQAAFVAGVRCAQMAAETHLAAARLQGADDREKELLAEDGEIQCEIRRLKANHPASVNQGLLEDANRYHWLRENHAWWMLKYIPNAKTYLNATDVTDEAIDAAIAAAAEKENVK